MYQARLKAYCYVYELFTSFSSCIKSANCVLNAFSFNKTSTYISLALILYYRIYEYSKHLLWLNMTKPSDDGFKYSQFNEDVPQTKVVYKRIIANNCHQIHNTNLIYIGWWFTVFGFDFPFSFIFDEWIYDDLTLLVIVKSQIVTTIEQIVKEYSDFAF